MHRRPLLEDDILGANNRYCEEKCEEREESGQVGSGKRAAAASAAAA